MLKIDAVGGGETKISRNWLRQVGRGARIKVVINRRQSANT